MVFGVRRAKTQNTLTIAVPSCCPSSFVTQTPEIHGTPHKIKGRAKEPGCSEGSTRAVPLCFAKKTKHVNCCRALCRVFFGCQVQHQNVDFCSAHVLCQARAPKTFIIAAPFCPALLGPILRRRSLHVCLPRLLPASDHRTRSSCARVCFIFLR